MYEGSVLILVHSLQLYFKHSLHPYIFANKCLFDSELNHVGNENPYIPLHDPYIFPVQADSQSDCAEKGIYNPQPD